MYSYVPIYSYDVGLLLRFDAHAGALVDDHDSTLIRLIEDLFGVRIMRCAEAVHVHPFQHVEVASN